MGDYIKNGWFYPEFAPPMDYRAYTPNNPLRPYTPCNAPVVAAIGAALSASIAGASVAGVLLAAGSALVLNGLSTLLAPDPPSADLGSFASIRSTGITRQVRQSITERRLIYGEMRTSGVVAFIEANNQNRYLHLVIALASHEVEEIGEVWINETSITDDMLDAQGFVTEGKYVSLVRIKKHLGADDQVADPDLVLSTGKWTDNHRLRGIAYIYVRLQWDRDVFFSGIPNISAWVRGKKVKNLASGNTEWSLNPAYIARDYLTDTAYGMAVDESRIDDSICTETALSCNEFVDVEAYSDNVIDADPSTNIITLNGVNDRLFFQTGDRINFTGAGLPSGLKISTENLALQSENIINGTTWKDIRGTLSSNQLKSPLSDEVTADLFTEDTATGGHYIYQDIQNVNTAETYTLSFYIKGNGRDEFKMRIEDLTGSGDIQAGFVLTSQTASLQSIDASSTFIDASIIRLNDGWFRISLTVEITSGGAINDVRIYLYTENGGFFNYTGDGASGFYVFGAQFEQNPYVTDYIKTESSAVINATNYYVIAYQRRDTPRIKVSNSYENALLGNEISIEGQGTGIALKQGEPRYTASGAIKTNSERGRNLKEILSSMAGQAVRAGGKWSILSGVYREPAHTFTVDDLAGALKIQTGISRRDRFNIVQGVYISQINDGNPSDYPAVENSTYLANDNNELLRKNLDLPFTNRPHTAQRIAKIDLERARQELIFTADFQLSAFQLAVGDNFYFTEANYGFSNKVFEVLSWAIAISDNKPIISITARENDSSVYDWNSGEETSVDPSPNSDLPDPFIVSVVGGFSLDSIFVETQGEDKIYNVIATWQEPEDEFVTSGGRFEIKYKQTTETEYQSAGYIDGDQTEARLTVMQPDVLYDVQIFAYNNLGVRSQPSVINNFQVGSTATTDTENWESETLARSGDDWENDTLTSEDWE